MRIARTQRTIIHHPCVASDEKEVRNCKKDVFGVRTSGNSVAHLVKIISEILFKFYASGYAQHCAHLINMMHNEDDPEGAIVTYTRRLRREIRAIVDPYRICESIFRSTYRLSKDLSRLVVRELTPFLAPDDNPLAVPNTVKVLCVLNFYATGSYQASVGCNWLHCLGRSTVGHFISEVTNALNERELQRRWIKFPRTRPERQQLSERHQQLFHIPGVIGFIGGTEVTITTPPEDMNPQSFLTRKHQYALNCQIICDSNLNILNINSSHAGASNDAFIYRFSAARRRMREAFENHPSCWLLGTFHCAKCDSIYPTEPWLLVPILGTNEGSAEEHYTHCHCRARNCVERCIGVLKGRFRCLLRARALHYHPVKAGTIVKACCLLHNICRKAGLADDDIEIVEEEEEPCPWVPQEHEPEMEAIDEEDDDPELQVDGDVNLRAVGLTVRSRVVDFLDMMRNGLWN